jgi:hypothetical protein
MNLIPDSQIRSAPPMLNRRWACFASALRLGALALALGAFAPVAQATVLVYDAFLDGPSESPPNGSPGTGFAEATYDTSAHTLHLNVTFSGLLGTTTASHIHAATPTPGTGIAGAATTTPTFAGFPLGVTAGSYDNLLDLTQASSWNSAYISANGSTTAGAEAALAAALASDEAYLNIHTSVVPGGEIRGFFVLVPEPSSIGLLSLGLAALAWRRRKQVA